MVFERPQMGGPHLAIWRQPGVQLAERSGFEPVDPLLRADAYGDDAGLAEHSQVLGHRGLAHPQRRNQLRDGALAEPQGIENAPTGGFGESGERIHCRRMPLWLYNRQGMMRYENGKRPRPV